MGLKLAHPYPPLQLGRREPYLLEKVIGKTVVDLGFVDVGHDRLEKGGLLHLEVAKRAKRTFGVDIDNAYRHLFPPDSENYQLFFGNVEDPATFQPIAELNIPIDLIVAGEIMEHLNNPGLFLSAIRTVMSPQTTLLVSVPNGLRAINFGYNQKGIEWVHPDHNYWYSPTTIQTLLNKNGYHVDFLRGYTFGSEPPESLGPSGLGCPGLICEARTAKPGEPLRRWPNTSVSTTHAGAVKDLSPDANPNPTAAPNIAPVIPAQQPPLTPAATATAPGTINIAPQSQPTAHQPASRAQPHSDLKLNTLFTKPPKSNRIRLLAITDQRGWAYENIVNALATHLADHIDIESIPYNELEEHNLPELRKAAQRADLTYAFSAVMPDIVYQALADSPIAAGIHNDYQLTHYADKLTPEKLSRFAAVGCLNENLTQRCRQLNLHPNIITTTNGIDASRFSPPADNRASRTQLRAGWAGQTSHSAGKVKRFYELVLPATVRAGIPLLPAIKEKNPLTHNQMPAYYQSIDLILCASIGEGTSGPLLEAAASAACPISTPVGSAPQQITHGTNGLLIEPTLDSLTNALYYCRTNPQHAIDMGLAARQNILDNWTWAARAQTYLKLFNAALEAAQTAAA